MNHRRNFLKTALAALPAAALARAAEVRLGAQSYSFRDRDLDGAIAGYQAAGLKYVELFSGHIEPTGTREKPISRDEIRKWRLETPLKHFEQAAAKIHAGGLTLVAYNYSFREDFTDAEVERGFEIAKALGVQWITASSNVTTAKRIDPFAEKSTGLRWVCTTTRASPPMNSPRRRTSPTPWTAPASTSASTSTSATSAPPTSIRWSTSTSTTHRILTLHIKDRKKNQGDEHAVRPGRHAHHAKCCSY
ncbi:MAG: hypothetical protein QM757_02055 [Paludibaculum sp.]